MTAPAHTNGKHAGEELVEHAIRLALEQGYVRTPKKTRKQIGDDDDEPVFVLHERLLKLSPELVATSPVPREYMLNDANTGQGVYVRGRVGLLAAAGGTGKTWVCTQLAVSQSTGSTWFGSGGWTPALPGRVLFLAAEEEALELLRMLYFATRAAHLNVEELVMLARNLDAVPLAGADVALTTDDRSGGLPMTHFAVLLRGHLRKAKKIGRPYSLVIIDPLSRFEGREVEKDPVAATRFVQVVETFAAEDCGRPSILIACHTRKMRKDDEATQPGADAIRGTSAIKDAARWAARLEQQDRKQDAADLLTLKIVKANGVPPQRRPLVLCRDHQNEGALRVATSTEINTNETVSNLVKTEAQKLDDYCDRVLMAIRPGELYSRNELIKLCGQRSSVLAAIQILLREKRIAEPKKGVLQLSTGAPVPAVPTAGNLFSRTSDSSVPPLSSAPFRGAEGGNRGGVEQKEPPPQEAVPRSSEIPEPGNRGEKQP